MFHEMPQKLCFIKCSERKVSQCNLALTNTTIDSRIRTGIIKTDITDHFAVFYLIKTNFEKTNIKKTIIERDINEDR